MTNSSQLLPKQPEMKREGEEVNLTCASKMLRCCANLKCHCGSMGKISKEFASRIEEPNSKYISQETILAFRADSRNSLTIFNEGFSAYAFSRAKKYWDILNYKCAGNTCCWYCPCTCPFTCLYSAYLLASNPQIIVDKTK